MPELPEPPKGWHLIAPAEARAGDALFVPADRSVHVLDERRFEPFPLELRRRSWAIRMEETA